MTTPTKEQLAAADAIDTTRYVSIDNKTGSPVLMLETCKEGGACAKFPIEEHASGWLARSIQDTIRYAISQANDHARAERDEARRRLAEVEEKLKGIQNE